MAEILKDLEPKKVFSFFEEISKIPRGSNNEKQISDYLVNFAKERNLEVVQDSALNVIIKKPASKGFDSIHPIILQSHMDMVCEKNNDTVHDFTKDPLKLKIDGDYIKADGTTLGADNGIGVAVSLAILDSEDISHPDLEVLITTSEESGMNGAAAFDPQNVKGKTLINLDSDTEGVFESSCAGGRRGILAIPVEIIAAPENLTSYRIEIKGLQGGHSGIEIHLEKGNSNIIAGRLLYELSKNIDIYLSNIEGGSKVNAIPRECIIDISIKKENQDIFEKIVNKINEVLKKELLTADPDVKIAFSKKQISDNKIISKESIDKLIKTLILIPNGVQSRSMDIKDLVESSNNIGVISLDGNNFVVNFLIRSSIKSKIDAILDKIYAIADITQGTIAITSEYPAMEYKKDSKIRQICEKVYQDMFNQKPRIQAIHAGLETGIFSEKIPEADIISMAPTMHNLHSPDEELSISSTQRFWNFLIKVIENCKNL